MDTIKLRFTGVRPLLMHNVALADPLSEQARTLKKLTSNRKKTDEDHAAIKRAEWFGGLVVDNGRPSLSADQVLGSIIAGGRRKKLGKDVLTAVQVGAEYFPLREAPRDLTKAYESGRFIDTRSVVIGGKRIMRTRPKFPEWSADVELLVDTTVMNKEQVLECATLAGEYAGIGDFRPRFGRYEVEEI